MYLLGSRAFVALSAALVAVAVVGITGASRAKAAEPANLEGSWSGGGNVRFAAGNVERARCRARFSRKSSNSFSMVATCATPSSKVEQTAQVTRTGPNRFAGEFENAEYGVTGSITITVSGNSLNASLNAGGGSAILNLNR